MTKGVKPLKPFFTYFGGKYRLGPKYPAPEYGTVIEPFAGSAGYSLRHWDRDVILYDLDSRVVQLWEFLISASPRDIRNLPLYDPYVWSSTDDLVWLSNGERLLIEGWLRRGGFNKSPAGWMRTGKYPTHFWGESARERVASQVEKIKHWKVVESSYIDTPNVPATWFVDPPYQVAGKGTYKFGSSGIDFSHLGNWCKSRQGQTIVCENDGADWLPFRPFAASQALNGWSREAVWISDEWDLI